MDNGGVFDVHTYASANGTAALARRELMQIRLVGPRSDPRPKGRRVLHGARTSGSRSLQGRAETLELAFDTKLIRRICESEHHAMLELGQSVAEVLKRRLADMRAATSPKDLVAGQPRIGADRRQMIVDLCDGHRIVLEANHPNDPKMDSDDVDWESVSRIKVLRIESDNV